MYLLLQGATVKPSLVFMRKFTADEESEYAKCKADALAEITALHQIEIEMLDNTITKADTLTDSLKDDLKKLKQDLNKLRKIRKTHPKLKPK